MSSNSSSILNTTTAQMFPTNSPLVLVLVNDYGVSYYYYYVHPVICAFGLLNNLINTIVLSTRKLRTSGPFFQYSLVNSAGAMICFILLMFLFLTKCGGSICSISTTYWSQAYTIYAIYYATAVYYAGSAFIQIAIGVQLYLSIKQKLVWLTSINPYKVSLVIFGFFALASIANLFLYQIDTFPLIKLDNNGHLVTERYYYSRLPSNSASLLIGTVILCLTSYLPFVVLIILNVLIYVELKRVMARRKNIIGPSAGGLRAVENSSKSGPSKLRATSLMGVAAGTNSSQPDNSNDVSTKRLSQIVLITNDVHHREEQEKKSLRRSLIMTLWVSLIFSSDRLIKCIYRSVVLVAPLSPYTFYLNAISYFLNAFSYSSLFFVYMYTNKIFKRTFYEIFLRKKSNQIN